MTLRFFPLSELSICTKKKNLWTPNKPPRKYLDFYTIVDSGDFGSVSTTWRREFRTYATEVDFNLNTHTWMLFDFRECRSLGIYSPYQDLLIRIENNDHMLHRGYDLALFEIYWRPVLFRFPTGSYKIFLTDVGATHCYFPEADYRKKLIDSYLAKKAGIPDI